ncbi:MAG: hypothetical protein N2595_00965 [bacterium]|nr:hypothetical protein [bacterium]
MEDSKGLFQNCKLVGWPTLNQETNSDSGGIYLQNSELIIHNLAALYANSASRFGGGIYLTHSILVAKQIYALLRAHTSPSPTAFCSLAI